MISLDVHPTVVAAAGGATPQGLDGVNLLPYVTGESKGTPHERLYWRFGAQWAIRDGNWKLLRIGDQPWELYDLAKDIGEKNNLAPRVRTR